MRGSNLLPARFRDPDARNSSVCSWLKRRVTPFLVSLSSSACSHPIHTIVFVALLASTSYIGLLETSLFENSLALSTSSQANLTYVSDGGKPLYVGEKTSWNWEHLSRQHKTDVKFDQDIALVTLVFPDSSSVNTHTGPLAEALSTPSNSSIKTLPSTSNFLAPILQDTTFVFSVPHEELFDFLTSVEEIPTDLNTDSIHTTKGTGRELKWIMKDSKNNGNGPRGAILAFVTNAWTEFIDLIKNAETLDIAIMAIAYLSMHLTFVSLFLAMRRFGSNVWLATSVLFSSVFAFLFGLVVTAKLGVTITVIQLSEGLPFLVVTVGFEKGIILTKAVLTAALNNRRQAPQPQSPSRRSTFTIHNAVQTAVEDKGFEIVRDYFIEIVVLVAGAASGIQGGLRQFCFLAAWILFFDCLLLFTFYTAIMSIKLEINRIKRHVTLRKALEEDGVRRSVAENVAASTEWPKYDPEDESNKSSTNGTTIFGRKVRDSSVPNFKILMVSGFVLVNVLNLCTIPFRHHGKAVVMSTLSSLSNALSPSTIDPFKVAENGLSAIIASAKANKLETLVTVLPPIKYELHYALPYTGNADVFDSDYAEPFFDAVGGRMFESILRSFEDPVLSKWIVVALTMSLVLNGYLFNAARWTIKDTPQTDSLRVNGVISHDKPPAAHIEAPVELAAETKGVEKTTATSVPLECALSKDGQPPRTQVECEQLLTEKKAAYMTDEELINLSLRGKIPGYALEKTLQNPTVMTPLAALTRAVKVRRAVVSRTAATSEHTFSLEHSKVPFTNFNYQNVHGQCCENVIGYLPLPLGVAGPLVVDGKNYFLPMATTEGVLVASTSRGAKAINAGGGAITVLTADGMTRGPCVSFDTLERAGAAKLWLDSEEGQQTMKNAFNSTSRFARLQSMKTAMAGTNLYIRFKTTTGDAMGMNMISKGVECALNVMSQEAGFEDMNIVSLSGNYCTDKKAAAINWIEGRGKSVVAEAIIPADVVKKILKTDVDTMVELNTSKNLIGSAMAGSIGGFNAHAANIVTAIFLATGQDPAQNVESSNCITIMKNFNGNLQISVSMPSIECGTIGGGTILEPQMAMLELLGVKGPHPTSPGENARQLARIIAAGVLAGELSLCGALAAGHLVRAHMAHNRSQAPTRSTTPVSAAIASNRGVMSLPINMTPRS
ncbi:MAG: 3-hydroxy-3-methylglutaryl-coenzyme A (HMG-CoA) reductase isozyme [Cirrosporium novae-zelandiae]|nr:MAG: 3-hydroxy-3-methylglutaryl-coenzyme A (HMG-CoA) reductase isozyme [Cirrosporium novae-zelandiae]